MLIDFRSPEKPLLAEILPHIPEKGGNQAVALGRLGADVLMVGKVGNDSFGEQYLNNLE